MLADRLSTFLKSCKPIIIIPAAFFIILILGILDYVTGFEISFSFFYLIPIIAITWCSGIAMGNLFSVVCMLVWLGSNYFAGETYSNEIIRFFNAVMRMILFSFIAYLINRLKNMFDLEREMSRMDFLTGLKNRREFFNQAEQEISRSSRYRHSFAVCYLDLDNFKQINDTLGHSAGDAALIDVAHILSENMRSTDIVARLGGDEFGILLPEIDYPSAVAAVEKLKQTLTETMQQKNMPITVSIGLAYYAKAPSSVDKILESADRLMYEVKISGKNAIRSSEND